LRIQFDLPEFLIQTPQELRQIAVAQRIAQRERPRRLVPRADGCHILERDPAAVPDIETDLFHLVFQLARVGADARHQFGERLVRHLLPARLEPPHGAGFRHFGPVLVVQRPGGKQFHCTDFLEGFEKALAAVHLAGADQQAQVVPRQLFKFLGQSHELFADLRRGRSVLGKEIAVLKPDHLGTAEKGECLERLAQARHGFQGLAAVRNVGVYDFMVHAPHLLRPLSIDLPRPLFHRMVILAKNKAHRQGGPG